MRESFASLLTQIRKIWLNRKSVFPIAVGLCAVGWTIVALLPDVYEGSATLYVDTSSMLGKVLGTVAVNTDDLDAEFVALARQRLLSRPNIERLVRETDLDLAAKTPEDMDRLLEKIATTIDISTANTSGGTGTRPNIFVLGIHHPKPEVAKKMIESLVDIFSESVIGSNRQSNDQTQQFLDEQIAQYQKKIDDTERRLTDFRRANIGTMPNQGTGVYSDMQAARKQAQQIELDLNRVLRQRSAIQQQLTAVVRSSSGGLSPEASKFQRWSRLTTELDTLLTRYTEEHPQVVATKKQIEELHFDPRGADAPRAASTIDPSTLQFELTRLDSDASSLQDSLREANARAAALQSSLGVLPEVDAQLNVLTRDYELNKQQYSALMLRRESARLSRDAVISTNGVQFQIIEPAHVGILPVEPKRGLLLSFVLVVGLGIAAGIGFMQAQIKPTFGDVRELEAATGLTAYGSIGVFRSAAKQRAHRLEYLAYIALFALLILSYVGLCAWMADDFKTLLR